MKKLAESPSQSFIMDLLHGGESFTSIAKATGIRVNTLKKLLDNQQRNLQTKNFIKLIKYWCFNSYPISSLSLT